MQRMLITCLASALVLTRSLGATPHSNASVLEGQKLNNLATLLLDIASAPTAESFSFVRPSDGWVFISFITHAEGTIRLTLDKGSPRETAVTPAPRSGPTREAMHYVTKGHHTLQIECTGTIALEHLTLTATPELIHCGPGFNPQIKSYGLFSMPPGSINKQPNVDYHVWMDQQMNLVANDPTLADIAGLNWWTSTLADQETVRFVGKLYRHYALEGRTDRLTRDPLFLRHIQNTDFEHDTDGWVLHPTEDDSIATKSFPRCGRIEGRYMGLGRPADPEHIGDTFLWMKRSPKGPNTFSQTIMNLQPGRLYSFKMLVCDYNDLITPKPRKMDETRSIAAVQIDDAEVEATRSFTEVYASSPEPKIPVCITCHWMVFRARTATATLTVSDWQDPNRPTAPFGQEQAFNVLEVQPPVTSVPLALSPEGV